MSEYLQWKELFESPMLLAVCLRHMYGEGVGKTWVRQDPFPCYGRKVAACIVLCDRVLVYITSWQNGPIGSGTCDHPSTRSRTALGKQLAIAARLAD